MANNVIVVLHHVEIERMKSWPGAIGRSITRLANEVAYFQRAFAPKKTGELAGRIHWMRKVYPTGIGFEAGSSAPYAFYPDQGTLPHRIRPRHPGGQLVFFWPKVGQVVRFNSVMHPGSIGTRFLERGMRRALSVWDRAG